MVLKKLCPYKEVGKQQIELINMGSQVFQPHFLGTSFTIQSLLLKTFLSHTFGLRPKIYEHPCKKGGSEL